MTTEPNVFDVISQALIAQAQAYGVLVHLLEGRAILPPGTTRTALDTLIASDGDASSPRLRHLNEILRQLDLLPPSPGASLT